MSKQQPTLEQKITAALNNPNIGSADLTELIIDTDAAIVEAEATAKSARELALDLTASSDVEKVYDASAIAALACDRLKKVLPRLRDKLADATEREGQERWNADYGRVAIMRDNLAEQFSVLYPAVTSQLVDLFKQMAACDQECQRIASTAPDNEQRRLLGPEAVARDRAGFSRSDPSIVETVQLPAWKHASTLLWPPAKPSFGQLYAQTMVPAHDPRFTSEWWKSAEQDKIKGAAAAAEWDKQEAARAAKSKQDYEDSLRR